MSGLTIGAYARHRIRQGLEGTTYRAVQKAVLSGRIKTDADGLIDPTQADQDWASNTRPRKQAAPKAGARPQGRPPSAGRPAAAPAASPTGSQPDGGGGALSDLQAAQAFSRSRAIKESYLAKLAKLEFEEKSGALVPVERVGKVMFEAARSMRTKMTALAATLAPLLVGLEDEHEIRKMLDTEFRTVLTEMAADMSKVTETADAQGTEAAA